MDMVRFFVSDEVGIWLTHTCHEDMTLAEFEEAFREEHGIPKTVRRQRKTLGHETQERWDTSIYVGYHKRSTCSVWPEDWTEFLKGTRN